MRSDEPLIQLASLNRWRVSGSLEKRFSTSLLKKNALGDLTKKKKKTDLHLCVDGARAERLNNPR